MAAAAPSSWVSSSSTDLLQRMGSLRDQTPADWHSRSPRRIHFREIHSPIRPTQIPSRLSRTSFSSRRLWKVTERLVPSSRQTRQNLHAERRTFLLVGRDSIRIIETASDEGVTP